VRERHPKALGFGVHQLCEALFGHVLGDCLERVVARLDGDAAQEPLQHAAHRANAWGDNGKMCQHASLMAPGTDGAQKPHQPAALSSPSSVNS
jgi:hypothetical protein